MTYDFLTVVNDEVVKDETIEILPGDKLIVQINSQTPLSVESRVKFHDYLKNVLSNNEEIILVPDYVSFKVLRISE